MQAPADQARITIDRTTNLGKVYLAAAHLIGSQTVQYSIHQTNLGTARELSVHFSVTANGYVVTSSILLNTQINDATNGS